MKPRAYSSMEAFVAHWRALRAVDGADALSAAERQLRRALDDELEVLDPAERAALESSSADGTPAANLCARRRQRALAKLLPLLTAAGWLQ